MDILILVLFLACFASMGLLSLWCDSSANRKER